MTEEADREVVEYLREKIDRLVKDDVTLHRFPNEFLEALYSIAQRAIVYQTEQENCYQDGYKAGKNWQMRECLKHNEPSTFTNREIMEMVIGLSFLVVLVYIAVEVLN